MQWLAAQPGVEVAGFDPARTTVAELARWKTELPSRLRRGFLSATPAPFVEVLRCVKDEDELALMKEAALVGCRLFEQILGILRPGVAEIEVAAELEHQARLLGAEGMSFETIVASGARSALPHGRATTAPLPRRGFVTLDFGIILKGYCSDMTRTVFLGTPKPRERERIPCGAGGAGGCGERRGCGCKLRGGGRGGAERFAQGGIGEAFSHSTGHGVGLEIHEPPRVGAGQTTRLQPGMVITIEPGVYLAGNSAFESRIWWQ